MKEINPIQDYYNQLAPKYDDDRFNNTYGKYLHTQETAFLNQKLKGIPKDLILDMGCGTGRFLDYANHGVDFSEGMLQEAKSKFPDRHLKIGDIRELPYEDDSFEAIYSLHVFMHLDMATVEAAIKEAHRVLKPNGIFIFDFPSKARRQLINYQKEGWHGNTALDVEMIQSMSKGLFEIKTYEGVLCFPIHRIPKRWRSFFVGLDSWLGKTFLKKWASYHLVYLSKILR